MNESGLCDYAGILGDSDDSDDDLNLAKQLAASWESLSIMDRLGLKSSADMTEQEVESAFTQFAMGFHCDQYTLTQRLQAERHDRIVAEENLQRELRQTRDMLQVLYERLPEVDSRNMIQQMNSNLQSLESNVDNVVKTAEMLGAAHQEARVSHAVELMSVHLEHLQKRHATESEEMLEVRKLLHRRTGRLYSDCTDDRELFRYSSQQPTRRRVSITLLPTQSEMKQLETLFLDNCKSKTPDEQTDKRQEDSPFISLSQDDDGDSSVFQSVTQVSPLCRRRLNSQLEPTGSSFEGEEPAKGEEPNTELCLTADRRPLLPWRSSYGWIVRIIFILIMLMIIALLY
ncbi:inositol 1,4,5-triphosphate receptor associated 2 [Danio aesculapii]|uniref:inositol 1,4,5-triphosphate receptor associated 2 n=1 Tax=Danio aesculapii TaxID=1142201 RepID=UPI0024C0036F|nr:inositol 1,4,5-triphosphate receptor associated 2 [Danio aesculapii]